MGLTKGEAIGAAFGFTCFGAVLWILIMLVAMARPTSDDDQAKCWRMGYVPVRSADDHVWCISASVVRHPDQRE